MGLRMTPHSTLTPSALAGLEAKLASATGADRIVDGVLWKMGDPESFERNCSFYGMKYAGHVHTKAEKREHIKLRSEHLAPAYTASIDSAIALVERCLPNWSWQAASREKVPAEAMLWPRENVKADDFAISAEAPTPALAICLALVRALAAQQGERG